jgi:hypothetical protein
MGRPANPINLVAGSVTVAGAVVVVVGSVLTWARWSVGPALGGATGSAAGTTSTEGKIVLALGILLALAGMVMALAVRRDLLVAMAIVAIVGGLLAAGFALNDIARKSRLENTFVQGFRRGFQQSTGARLTDAQVRLLMARLGIRVSLGPGLFVAVAGGLLGAAGGVAGLVLSERMPSEPWTPVSEPPPTTGDSGPPSA